MNDIHNSISTVSAATTMEASKGLLISVIVPVYNVAPYLKRCLDSICQQTYGTLEIICVNDGSTDESEQILAEYANLDSRIVVINQENQGLSVARNVGMRYAHGEWISPVDSDDYMEPNAYECLVPLLTEDIDMVCFSAVVEGEKADQVTQKQRYFDLKESGIHPVDPELINGMHDTAWSKLFRRSIIERYHIEFAPGLWFEDYGFKFNYLSVCRAVYMYPARLYHYVLRDNSIMELDRHKHIKMLDRLRELDFIYTFIARNGMWQAKKELVRKTLRLMRETVQESPSSFKHQAKVLAVSLIRKWNLRQEFPDVWWIQNLSQSRCERLWRALFYKVGEFKTTYAFFGLPLVVQQRKEGRKIIRILGVKVYSRPLVSAPSPR